jgi:flavin-dependent dehydrogenase
MNYTIEAKPYGEYDVVVCGGGTAGVCAAIASAREGAKTLIVETGSALGGMATLGMVSKWAPFTDREKVIYESIPREIMVRYKERVGFADDAWNWVTIIPEQLKIVYDEMVTESGADVLFDSRVCHCVTGEGAIECVLVSNKSGLTPYRAKTYVDATGDGDLAAFAGVPFDMGDENGAVQSGSLCFIISDANLDALTESINSNPSDGFWARVIAEGK